MGFSDENLAMALMTLALVSGGNILSIHCMPLFPKPVTVPWREPVKPPSASAMAVEGITRFLQWSRDGIGTEFAGRKTQERGKTVFGKRRLREIRHLLQIYISYRIQGPDVGVF